MPANGPRVAPIGSLRSLLTRSLEFARILALAFAIALWSGMPVLAQTVAIATNSQGLTSLTYGGTEFVGNGDFRVTGVLLQNGSGSPFQGDLNASSVQMDVNQTLTRTYSWGKVVVNYAASGNRLTQTITTTNTSSTSTIQGLYYEPIAFKFPSAVQEYDGNTPMLGDNISGPTLLSMSYGSGVMVMVNEDVVKPLASGFPWAFDRPTNRFFPLRVNTNRENMYPTFFPFINRPIAPGASDQFRFSYRFGPPGSTIQTLAGDMYTTFRTAFPRKVTWNDGRPIGALFLSTTAAGFPRNPRGWLLDAALDTTTPAGIASFQARILAYADSSITYLKAMNAQGMVAWDIEGQQFPHATSYLCDPTQLALLAPEMNAVADAFFKKFRDAGLKVGVCVRPQQLVVAPDLSSASQLDVADPTNLLISKIQYAKQRWGATMFYVDSNGGPSDPTDPGVFQRVLAAVPDILMIPEHNTLKYYAYTAPLLALHQGKTAPPDVVKTVYPDTVAAIFTPDGSLNQYYDRLVTSVRQGNMLIYRSWFDDQPNNTLVKNIYADAGRGAAPTAPPTVAIASPVFGATVTGTTIITANVTAAAGVGGVQFKVDGINLGAEQTIAPYSALWNTSTAANGTHAVTAVVRDTSGATASAAVSVTVSNVVADLTPPTVSLTSPAGGATLSRIITVSANASDNVGVVGVQFKLDGANLGAEQAGPTYALTFDTTSIADGTHTFSAVARDAAANQGTAANVTVTVKNAAPPTVSITSPAAGAGISGVVTVMGTAQSSVGIAGVQFKLNSANLGSEVTTAPYAVSWNTADVANGSHTLTAVARDNAGTTAQAGGVGVTVNNIVRDTTPPTVSISSPSGGATVSGTITVMASAADNTGVVGVQLKLDGANLGNEIATAPYSMSLNTTSLSNGVHTLSASARDAAGNVGNAAAISFAVSNAAVISCAAPGNGVFTGCYYSDLSWTTLAMTRSDASINFSAPSGSAMIAGLPASRFSVRWQGNFTFTGGDYEFVLGSDDGSVFYIDGQVVMNNWGEHAYFPFTVKKTLSAGTHAIRLDYYQVDGAARVSLAWTGGSTASAPIVVSPVVPQAALAVALTSPSAGAVSGTVAVSATATGPSAIAGVQFKLDGANLQSEVTAAPYQISWNTAGAANGAHTLSAVARDTSGATLTSASVSVTVSNSVVAPTDTTPPTVSITSPAGGTTLSSNTVITASAADNVGVMGVQFKLDGVNLGSEVTTAPYSISFNTTTVSNGSHILSATARDAAGNQGSAIAVYVSVDNSAIRNSSGTCPDPGNGVFTGCYYSGLSWQTMSFSRSDPTIDFTWLSGSSVAPGLPAAHFSVRWQGNFNFTGGNYKFTLGSDDGSVLYIDGQMVMNNWGEHAYFPFTVNKVLTPGNHVIRLDYYQVDGNARVSLGWNLQ